MIFRDNLELTSLLRHSINERNIGTSKLMFKGNLEIIQKEVGEVIERKMLEIGNYSSIVTVINDDDGFSRVLLVFNKKNK